MGGAMFPPCYLPGPNHGGGNEDNGDLPQKIPCMHRHTQCPQPCGPPLTHAFAGGKSPVGSLFLSPGSWCTRFCHALHESISQSYISSGSSIVGLIATSFKMTYSIPTLRAPVPAGDHCWLVPPQEMLKHSFVSVSLGFLGPGAHKYCLNPLSVSDKNGDWF